MMVVGIFEYLAKYSTMRPHDYPRSKAATTGDEGLNVCGMNGLRSGIRFFFTILFV